MSIVGIKVDVDPIDKISSNLSHVKVILNVYYIIFQSAAFNKIITGDLTMNKLIRGFTLPGLLNKSLC